MRRLGFLAALCLAWPTALHAEVPAQTIVGASASTAWFDDGPALAVSVYGWSMARVRSLSAYAGPSWAFLHDRLWFEAKVGAYVDDTVSPALNLSAGWQAEPWSIDGFLDVYGPTDEDGIGTYFWLSGQRWFGPLFVGAQVETAVEEEFAGLTLGPSFGAGSSALSVGLSPVWTFEREGQAAGTRAWAWRLVVQADLSGSGEDEP